MDEASVSRDEFVSDRGIHDAQNEYQELKNINPIEEKKPSADFEALSSLLDEFLMHQPPEIQRRVRRTVEIWGIDKDDPYFLILLQCRITQVLIELTPNAIRKESDEFIRVLEYYKVQLAEIRDSHLLSHAKAQQGVDSAIKQLKELGKAISDTLKQNQQLLEDHSLITPKRKLSPKVIVSVITAASTLIALTTGAFLGSRSAFASDWLLQQEDNDRELLNWAKSSQGKFAKDVMTWNPDLANQNCQQYAEDLGISFQIGSKKVTSGFCVVFTVPPNKRTSR